MSVSSPFIRRPVGTTLLALALFLVGSVAYFLLPVASLPAVDFPIIMITAARPGADPETMAESARQIRNAPSATAAKIRAASETASGFDWSIVTTRLLQLYEEITAITKDCRLRPRLSPRTWSTETNCSQNV